MDIEADHNVCTYFGCHGDGTCRVDYEPSPKSMRDYIERNAIGPLSNYNKIDPPEALDPLSIDWLDHHC